MSFESELSRGVFCIPECAVCKKICWPLMEFCNSCFGVISLRCGDFEGKVIEFSREHDNVDNDYFCLVEFEDAIRVVARISRMPEIGQRVRISKCGIVNGDYFFNVHLVD